MRTLGLVLLIAGAVMLLYALSIPAYTNEALFFAKSTRLSVGQSDEYFALRDSMLTLRFRLEDYGITLLSAGALLLLCQLFPLISPPRKAWLVAIAFVAPCLTFIGDVTDLFVGYSRDEFPAWADSMLIPLAGTIVLLVLTLFWAMLHLLFVRDHYAPSAPLKSGLSREANLWLLFVTSITVLMVVATAAMGQYYYAVPGLLWIYFYLSLASGRRLSLASNNSFKPKPLRGSA
jgi:hypothetical protein